MKKLLILSFIFGFSYLSYGENAKPRPQATTNFEHAFYCYAFTNYKTLTMRDIKFDGTFDTYDKAGDLVILLNRNDSNETDVAKSDFYLVYWDQTSTSTKLKERKGSLFFTTTEKEPCISKKSIITEGCPLALESKAMCTKLLVYKYHDVDLNMLYQSRNDFRADKSISVNLKFINDTNIKQCFTGVTPSRISNSTSHHQGDNITGKLFLQATSGISDNDLRDNSNLRAHCGKYMFNK